MNLSSPAHPLRHELDAAWSDDQKWAAKLDRDRARAHRNQTTPQREITEIIVSRSLAIGADGVALTGSTARDRRTSISDLDYHVVGQRPKVNDLPGDVDVYAGDADHFWKKLRGGDDFVQWTLRLGCILHDSGIFRAGLEAIAREGLWPDPSDRMARLGDLETIARRLLKMGDRDAAQTEIRAALTTAARGVLLANGSFPLARSELPAQLMSLGHDRLASALETTIHGEPRLEELEQSLAALPSPLSPERA